jgi:hypothetical protein
VLARDTGILKCPSHVFLKPTRRASPARPLRKQQNRTPSTAAYRKADLQMAIRTPKGTEQKMERMLNAWQELAPDKSFGGMTLAQFQAAAAPSQQARERIDDLEDQLRQALADRDTADDAFLVKAQQAVAGVLADPTEGPDSALYEAFGYTRKSERKSGLTRKRSSTK